MDNQVKITLKALTSNVTPAERVFFLSPNRPTIPIGRASKSISKGLLSEKDNAWVDSPVMSRDHAKMAINMEDKTVTIQDIGSMHGTYLNDFELPRQTPMEIDDGDIVVFGAEVRRGPETFPACRFKVNYEFLPYKPANTFRFPDSDVEEEDEESYDNFSEDGIVERERSSSEDGYSVDFPPAKFSTAGDPIDLTGFESPIAASSNRVDLTSDNSAEEGLMDLMEGHPADISSDADAVNIAIYAGNAIYVASEGEDEDAHFSMDSDEQSAVAEDGGSSESENQDVAKNSEPSKGGDQAEDPAIEDAQKSSGIPSEQPSRINSNIRFALATHDNSVVRLSDIRTRIAEPKDIVEEDDQSDFGLSEAGEAGIRALFEDGLLRHGYEDPYPVSGEVKDESGMGNSRHITFASASSTQENNLGSTACQSTNDYAPLKATANGLLQGTQSTLRRELKLSDPGARQPSPSDAAMAKSQMPTRDPAHVGICDLAEVGNPAKQVLGEKIGKSDFFEARAFNKAKFAGGNKAGTSSGTGLNGNTIPAFVQSSRTQQPTAATNPFAPRPTEQLLSASQPADAEPSIGLSTLSKSYYSFADHQVNSCDNKLVPADIIHFPTREQCSFLDNPAHGPTLDRVPSPEPYMTSAVNFNAATHKTRSGLGINDIINNASTSTSSLKRRACDISVVTDAELRIWAQSSSTSNGAVNVSANETTPEVQAPVSNAETEVIPPQSDEPVPRPTKKLRKFLENVGYAALGGVAVGAGLFSVLVASAPDFL